MADAPGGPSSNTNFSSRSMPGPGGQEPYYNNSLYSGFDITDNFFAYDRPERIVLICFYVPLFVLAMVGNVLVLLMVACNREMRKSTANYFLVNLAIADLLGECINNVRAFSFVFYFVGN
jgi:hypothetical protein